MNKIFFILLMTLSFSLFSQVEMKYNANSESLPIWTQLMYAEKKHFIIAFGPAAQIAFDPAARLVWNCKGRRPDNAA